MVSEPAAGRPVIDRLERARTQLARVIAMMEQGAECEDLVAELAAVDKALAAAGYVMVAQGLQQCLVAGSGTGEGEALRLERLFLGFA